MSKSHSPEETATAAGPTTAVDQTESAPSKEASRSTWGELEISQRAFGYMPFRNFHVSIYESAITVRKHGDERKFFCSPLVVLDPESAEAVFNWVTEQHQVRFQVELWNQDVETQVVEYLSRATGSTVNDFQVTVIPFEEVILSSLVSSELFEEIQGWVPYQLHERVLFTLNCPSKEKADKVVKVIKEDPVQFASVFRIKFSLTTRESRKKETVIRMENITSGKLFGKLEQRYPVAEYVYLTAEDVKNLLSESVNNVLVESFSDNEVVSAGLEAPIYSILEKMMVSAKETIEGDGKKWDFVFWSDENSRPDRVAQIINESFEKSDQDTQKKLIGEFDKVRKGSINLSALKIPLEFGGESSTHSNLREAQELIKDYFENRNKVEWNGNKFIPKSMSLSKINLSKIRSSDGYNELKTKVTYSMAILTMTINVIEEVDENNENQMRGKKRTQTEIDPYIRQAKFSKAEASLLYFDQDADQIQSPELSTSFLMYPDDMMKKMNEATEEEMLEIQVYSQPIYHYQPIKIVFYDTFVVLKTRHTSTHEQLFWSIEFDKVKGLITLQRSKDEKVLLRDCRRERRPSNWFAPVARFKTARVERGSTVQDLLDFVWGNRWERMRKPSIVFDETNVGFTKAIFNQFKTGGWDW